MFWKYFRRSLTIKITAAVIKQLVIIPGVVTINNDVTMLAVAGVMKTGLCMI